MVKSKSNWRREQQKRNRERARRAKQRRNCTLIVMLLIVVVIIVAVVKSCGRVNDTTASGNETKEIEQTTESVNYTSSIDVSKLNTKFFNNTAFVGNSVFDSIDMYNLIDNGDFYTNINLTIDNVYTTATGYGTTSAADQLKSKKFAKVFLSFGQNEIQSMNIDDFITAYETFIDKIDSYQPTTQIYVVGITPITKNASNQNLYGLSNDKIKDFNKNLKNMAADKSVYYVDSVAALGSDNGCLPDGVSADGINLNRDYCFELLEYILDNSEIPDSSSSSDDEDDEDDEDSDNASKTTAKPTSTTKPKSTSKPTEKSTQKPSETTKPSGSEKPEPTVNVLKDTVTDKKTESD